MGTTVYVLLLACPLAMMFMMRGMTGGGKNADATAQEPRIVALEAEVTRLHVDQFMDAGVDAICGAARGERSPERVNRQGHRERH